MAGTTGVRAVTNHWLPSRIGPRMDEPGTGRAPSADSHSLAIPLALAASAGREASTWSPAVIQRVLLANGTDSSEVNLLVSASAWAAAAAWRLARLPSLWNSGSILLTYAAAIVVAVARAAVAWCWTLRYIRRDPAMSTTASTTSVGSQPKSRFILINAATFKYRDVLCGR